MAEFKVVKKYIDCDIDLIPKRSTANAAGYDMVAAEDKIIPSYLYLMQELQEGFEYKLKANFEPQQEKEGGPYARVFTLDEMTLLTKLLAVKPTLVSTGVKVYLNKNQYLQIVSRSSSPLKYWLVCANGIGIIDADYADNPGNEGEIFFQVINLSPFPIKIRRGDKICQGIIQSYETVNEDDSKGARVGGFGSTGT